MLPGMLKRQSPYNVESSEKIGGGESSPLPPTSDNPVYVLNGDVGASNKPLYVNQTGDCQANQAPPGCPSSVAETL